MERAILIAGSGGQGVLFIGDLLCYSAILEGKEVTSFPSYGVEKIGGFTKCTIIISDEMIGSPITEKVDMLIAMNNWAINKFINKLNEGGLLFYDSTLINTEVDCRCNFTNVPASQIAFQEGSQRGANMVMLGALVAATAIVDLKTIYKALMIRTPLHRRDSLEVNKKLILKGYKYFENKKG